MAKAQRRAISTGVGDGVGQVGEQRPHLGAALEVVLRRQPAAVGVGEVRALRRCTAARRAPRTCRAWRSRRRWWRRSAGRASLGEREQRGLDRRLALQPVALQLDVEAVAERLAQLRQQRLGGLAPALQQQPAERALRTAGQQDQSVGVRAQRRRAAPAGRDCAVGASVGAGQQPQQVGVARGVLDQDDDRVAAGGGCAPALPPLPHAACVERQRELAADDRLDARLRAATTENSMPPNRLLVSVIATAGIACSRHSLASSLMRIAPSESE